MIGEAAGRGSPALQLEMTRIKVCGITNPADAQVAAECGADAIGFVFAESPRRVAPETAREVMRSLEPFVVGVGVFVNAPVEEVRRTLEFTGCAVAQLHGDEEPGYVEALAPYGVVKVVRVRQQADDRDAETSPPYRLDEAGLSGYKGARALLLDTLVGGAHGGTGRRFDVRVAADLVKKGWRVIVAGGLSPDNVGEVVTSVRPYGVDVSSGVESAPGRKDPDKVARFAAAVRAADGMAG